MSLSFTNLRSANVARLPEFKNCHGAQAHSHHDGSDWTPAQWFQAWVGEVGEFAQVRCDFESGKISGNTYAQLAAKELPDSVIYQDLLALRALDVVQKGDKEDDAQKFMRAMAGIGSYANARKKFDRGDIDQASFSDQAYLFLEPAIRVLEELMAWADQTDSRKNPVVLPGPGIDLGSAVIDKFNETSIKVGVNVFLGHTAD